MAGQGFLRNQGKKQVPTLTTEVFPADPVAGIGASFKQLHGNPEATQS